MKNKYLLFFILILILLYHSYLIKGQWVGEEEEEEIPEKPPYEDWTADDWKAATPDQLSFMTAQDMETYFGYVSGRLQDLPSDSLNSYLRDRYNNPSLNVDVGGAVSSLVGDVLTIGGTTINLNSFSPGLYNIEARAGKVLINGHEYTGGKNLRVENGVIKGDDLESGEFTEGRPDYEFAHVNFLRDRGYYIVNGNNVKSKLGCIEVESAEKVEIGLSEVTELVDLDSCDITEFSLSQAGAVIIGSTVFADISDSEFKLFNSNLVSASVVSDEANNTFDFPNPIQFSSPTIRITANMNDAFEINYTKLIDGKKAVEYAGDVTTVFQMGNISFVPREGGSLVVIEGIPPQYMVTNGILNYTTAEFVEVLDTCSESNVFIDYAKGFKLLTLSPFTEVLCPGGRYSYINKVIKQTSYSIFNSGLEYYELGFNKAGLLIYDDFIATLIGDKSFGYVDFPRYLELNGIVQYDRYREFDPSIELWEEYLTSSLVFMPVYKSFDNDNKARLGLIDGRNVDFYVENLELLKTPASRVVLEVNSGFHKITEVQQEDSVSAYEDYNRDPRMPPYVTSYKSFFDTVTEEISIVDQTLSRQCNGSISFFVYTPGSPVYELARSQLKVKSGIARIVDFTAMMPK